MNDKVFKVAGVATDRKGSTKVRYANDLDSRIKVLSRNRFTNINLIDLDNDYDKFEICQILLSDYRFTDYIDIINSELARIDRLSDDYSVKMQKKQRKLALANISAEEVLDLIK